MAIRGARKQRPAVRVNPRREERDKAGERSGGRAATLGRVACGVLAIGLAWLVYQLLNAPAFRVERVAVEGNSLLSREEITRAAGVLGQSIFGVDRRRVASAVAGLGILRRVDVAVALPNSVAIRVEEYAPRYVWQAGKANYLVDERGIVLASVDAAPPLPAVREVEGKARHRGDAVSLEVLQAVARLAASWPAALGERPAFEYGPAGLTAIGGAWRADFGEGDELAAKLLALEAVLRHVDAEGKNLSYVDLRVVDRPYFK